MNTLSSPTYYIKTLSISPYTSPFVKQSDIDNTINSMFAKIIDKLEKKDETMKSLFEKQDTEVDKKIVTQLQTLTIQVK